MLLRYPAYYPHFRCIADACPDSCCKEWDVLVDEESAARYLALSGPLGDDLRGLLRQDAEGDWYFPILEGRCPMWRGDGLCRIQAEQGHDALCQTCRDFPRIGHDYGDFVEQQLALSCPEAARLIFSEPDVWLQEQLPGGEEGDYDSQDMEILLETRKVMLTILADETRSVPEILALALLYGYRAQAALDGGEVEAFSAQQELSFGRSVAKKSDWKQLIEFYVNLEILTPQWRRRLEDPAGEGPWDRRLLCLARYGVQRYWLQAVSDFDLVGRVKMVVSACLLVHFLGGDTEKTAQLYAKEIENSEENVDAILDGAYTNPALTDEKLLGWLLL